MSSFLAKDVMGMAWLGLSLPCLLAPSLVLKYSINKEILDRQPLKENNSLDCFILRCFGSQATLCGILLLSSNFTKETYKIWAVSMIPFFVFDVAAYHSGYLTAFGAIGDGIGNIIFFVSSLVGAELIWKKH